jgi:hypothetical protein
MDPFEEFQKNIAAVDARGRAGMIAGQKDRCICSRCLTYNECMRETGDLLYCCIGRSPVCTFERKGCICPMCPVKDLLGLQNTYHCTLGSEKEQRTTTSRQKEH